MATATDKPDHYFSVCTETNNGKHTSCRTNADTMREAIAKGIKDAMYYRNECDYPNPTFSIQRICSECCGEGTVPPKRGFTPKRCPLCKGRYSSVVIAQDVPLQLDD